MPFGKIFIFGLMVITLALTAAKLNQFKTIDNLQVSYDANNQQFLVQWLPLRQADSYQVQLRYDNTVVYQTTVAQEQVVLPDTDWPVEVTYTLRLRALRDGQAITRWKKYPMTLLGGASQMSALYDEITELLTVEWERAADVNTYVVKVLQDDAVLLRKITQYNQIVLPIEFTAGTTYTIKVRPYTDYRHTFAQWSELDYTFTPALTCPELEGQMIVTPQVASTGPQTIADDPYYHAIHLTTSTTPTSFTPTETAIFEHTSVADIVYLDSGLLLLYALYFPIPEDGSSLIYSCSADQGATWTEPLVVQIDGVGAMGYADPSVVQLEDGQIRLYLYKLVVNSAEGHTIYSAISEDSLNFTFEAGERISLTNITDPEVIKFGDSWLMYLSNGSTTQMAQSNDGLNFTLLTNNWSGGGVPGAYADDNTVYIYGCNGHDITMQQSSDGINFSASELTTALTADNGSYCDPSPVQINDDTIMLVYKHTDV